MFGAWFALLIGQISDSDSGETCTLTSITQDKTECLVSGYPLGELHHFKGAAKVLYNGH